MKTLVYASGVALFAMLSAGRAFAGNEPPLVIERAAVFYRDLDLATPAGAEAMLARLEAAAARACGGNPAPTTSSDAVGKLKRREYRRCRTAAIDVATTELGAPLVRTAWLERDEAAHAARARRDSIDLLQMAGLPVPAGLSRD